MGWTFLLMTLAGQIVGDTAFSFEGVASISGALSYNYVDPYLYLLNYDYKNPASASCMRGAVTNPAALALVKTVAGAIAAGFGRTGGVELTLSSEIPYVGEVKVPISFYAEEASGVYFGGGAARMGEVVVGFAYVEGDRFNGDIFARADVAFSATYSLRDTLTEADLPGQEEGTTIPILIDLKGEGGGSMAIEGRARLKATPFYLILATEEGGINYGVAFRWSTFDGWIDYTDTLTPVLKPTGARVYSESDEWDVGVSISAVVEGGEIYSNKYSATLVGNQLGAAFGMQKPSDLISWGFSVEQDLGANILRTRIGRSRRGGLPRVVELNTENLEVDADARILKGEMTVVLGYDDLQVSEVESRELLTLPPRTSFRGGIQVTPGDWIIDASFTASRTWGRGTSEVFFGTGFGYNWKVPIRFSQALFYRVTKIEEMPIYSIPGLFFGVSTTLEWKGLGLDLSIRANTTTALFGNYAAAIDPDVPDLGIINYLSAGAGLSYGF
ncbi:hypothetical protein GH141_03070 [bacterium]|nr:hypothetical protein [bacterium]